MSGRVSSAEIERLMAEAVDDNGVDVALERATEAMSPAARHESEENLRRWAERAQRALRNGRNA